MDKEKAPSFFASKGFVEDISKEEFNQQPSTKKDKPMTNENDTVDTAANPKKPRKRLTSEQVARMIKEWDDKSISEWVKEFDVSYQTVVNMAEVVNKEDALLCQKKTAVKVKREDIAKEAIELFKKGKGKK